ncbi:rhomboid family serine protease [Myxococcus hansupus]|uniref:Rhomboid family serine protease n=1 Tax=Pseudomyxococcus hansupus TaxID=1297742 RepID=A0A0H4XMX3_9BACT|nr:rhomboid family intramembrane serine protease [Myxococcus hansupus]AKQ69712.1 rhomboid family serine protease [Myxococcus hansupus]
MSAQPQPEPPPPASSSAEQEDASFAVYLVRKLLAEQGFEPGTFPEASALEAASDAVLTYSDGMSAVIVCVVDREQSPSRVFGLDVAALERIGKDCLKYTGGVGGTKLPLGLQVIEVGGAALSEEDRKRLHALRLGLFNKVHLQAMHVDTRAKTVWASTWRRAKVSRGYLRGLVSAPRRVAEPEDVAEPPERKPWLTYVSLVAMACAFIAEHLLRLGAEGEGPLALGVQTLVALGGVNSGLVLEGGQWWRLLTAPLLHGDLFHLLFNGFCLWFVGQTLETLVGRAWLGLLLWVGALGGGALSMAINDVSVVSVGASGVVTALLGALLAVSRRYPPGPERVQLQMMSIQMLLPSLLPVVMTRTGGAIDCAAHLGGALAGGAVGLVLTQVWSRREPEPPARMPLLALGWVAFAALLMSMGAAWRYRQMLEL